MWSKLLSSKGREKIFACRNLTFLIPFFSVFSLAFSRDSGEMSIEVISASGLFFARITVWAPIRSRLLALLLRVDIRCHGGEVFQVFQPVLKGGEPLFPNNHAHTRSCLMILFF
jgi:hypothetical protein